jgi:hypothetical protein
MKPSSLEATPMATEKTAMMTMLGLPTLPEYKRYKVAMARCDGSSSLCWFYLPYSKTWVSRV